MDGWEHEVFIFSSPKKERDEFQLTTLGIFHSCISADLNKAHWAETELTLSRCHVIGSLSFCNIFHTHWFPVPLVHYGQYIVRTLHHKSPIQLQVSGFLQYSFTLWDYFTLQAPLMQTLYEMISKFEIKFQFGVKSQPLLSQKSLRVRQSLYCLNTDTLSSCQIKQNLSPWSIITVLPKRRWCPYKAWCGMIPRWFLMSLRSLITSARLKTMAQEGMLLNMRLSKQISSNV